MNNINKTTEYWADYRSVSWIINYNERDGVGLGSWWTYYIVLSLNRLPERVNPDSFWLEPKKPDYEFYDYNNHPTIKKIDFYGGITFYEKKGGIDESNMTKKRIKIGCDYSHSWDLAPCGEKFIEYDFDHIYTGVTNTINSFLVIVPEYEELEEKQ